MSKKVLVFRGPAHHSQLMRPVEAGLKKLGYDVVLYTADTEACFQAGLNKEVGTRGYRWLPDYYNDRAAVKIYRFHMEWFKGLFKTPNPLSLMAPQVLDRISLFTVRDSVATQRLIEDVKPAFCLALHELNRWGMLLGYHAQEKKIPFFTLQEGLYYGDPFIYTGHNRFSHSFVWGDATRSKLLASGNSPDRVHSAGHPDLGGRTRGSLPLSIPGDLPEEARGRKIIFLFLGMIDHDGDLSTLLDGIADSNYFVVARIHQLSSLPAIEKARASFDRPGSMFSFEREDDFAHHWRLIAHADLFIHVGCTTTALEWAYTGKPQGQIYSRNMHRDFSAEGISVPVQGMRLLDACRTIEAEWERGSWKENQKRFVEQELAGADAAEQIASEMARMSSNYRN